MVSLLWGPMWDHLGGRLAGTTQRDAVSSNGESLLSAQRVSLSGALESHPGWPKRSDTLLCVCVGFECASSLASARKLTQRCCRHAMLIVG